MANRYNFFYFEAEFKKYLIAGNAEASTIKSYVSDLHYFFSWVQNTQHISELDYLQLEDVFSHALVRSYHEYLQESTGSESTTTRRLATLRKFFSFCQGQNWLTANPALDFKTSSKRDEREHLLISYKQSLTGTYTSKLDLERHINVIRELVTHY